MSRNKVLFIITSKETKNSMVTNNLFQVILAVGKLVSSVDAEALELGYSFFVCVYSVVQVILQK